MGKNIVICCDGTGNGFSTSTHVARFADVCHESTYQVVYYSSGIGASRKDWFRKYLEMTLGIGLTYRLRKAYEFLVEHYNHGDNIYLIGFSRGAYTVRSLAGLIQTVGILDKRKFKKNTDNTEDGDNEDNDDLSNKITKAIYLYQERNEHPSDDGTTAFRRLYSHNTDDHSDRRIRFLGVWDTVGSLGLWGIAPTLSWVKLAILGYLGWMLCGILSLYCGDWINNLENILTHYPYIKDILKFILPPISAFFIGAFLWSWKKRENERFHNCKLGRYIDCAYHIMAEDEQRLAYRPQFWTPREGHDDSDDDEDWGTEKWRNERTKKHPSQEWKLQTLIQYHIKGSHSDIGGGYARNKIGHTTFENMLTAAKAQGIEIHPEKEKTILERFGHSEKKYAHCQGSLLRSQTYSSTNNSTTLMWIITSMLVDRGAYSFFWTAWNKLCKRMRGIFNFYPCYELDISSEKPLFKGSGFISPLIKIVSFLSKIIWWGLAPIWWSFAHIIYLPISFFEEKKFYEKDDKDSHDYNGSILLLMIATSISTVMFIGTLIYYPIDFFDETHILKFINDSTLFVSIFAISSLLCSFLQKKPRIITDAVMTLILAFCLSSIIVKSYQKYALQNYALDKNEVQCDNIILIQSKDCINPEKDCINPE